MPSAVVLGDSQGVGLEPVLGPILARHGYTLDTSSSWTQNGASLDAIASHVAQVGAQDLAIVVSGGGNDAPALVRDPVRYGSKLSSVVGSLRGQGVGQVIWVGPMHADDPDTAAQHDAARAVQSRGIPGARWLDGYAMSQWVPHPAGGDGIHWGRAGYQSIALELEKSLFENGVVTAVGLVGTLAFLGALGVITMELLYERAGSAVD